MFTFSSLSDLLALAVSVGVLMKLQPLHWSHIRNISFEAISCWPLGMAHCSSSVDCSKCDVCICANNLLPFCSLPCWFIISRHFLWLFPLVAKVTVLTRILQLSVYKSWIKELSKMETKLEGGSQDKVPLKDLCEVLGFHSTVETRNDVTTRTTKNAQCVTSIFAENIWPLNTLSLLR